MFESIKSMGTSEPGPNDIIGATVLNVTKFGALIAGLVPAVLGVFDALNLKFNGAEMTFTPGQWALMIFAALGLMVLLMLTDMVVRGYVTAHSAVRAVAVSPTVPATIYNHGEVHNDNHRAPDKDGNVEAFMIDANGEAKVLVDNGRTAEWVAFEDIDVRVP